MDKTYSWNEICGTLPELSSSLAGVRRIIVIGDLHGDYDKTIKSLQLADVITIDLNGKPKWTTGVNKDTIVVQVGDQIDSCRGDFRSGQFCDKSDTTEEDKAEDIKILNMFTNLHNQAINHGGAVYSLLGNHEIMNTTDRLEYVSYENLMEFKNFDYKKYDQIKPFYEKKKNMNGGDNSNDIESAKNNRIKEFTPGNPLANFLGCTRQMILKIRDIESSLGTGIKSPATSEFRTMVRFKKSIYLIKDVKKGNVITESMLALKGPAYGILPKYMDIVIGHKVTRDLLADQPLTWEDIT